MNIQTAQAIQIHTAHKLGLSFDWAVLNIDAEKLLFKNISPTLQITLRFADAANSAVKAIKAADKANEAQVIANEICEALKIE